MTRLLKGNSLSKVFLVYHHINPDLFQRDVNRTHTVVKDALEKTVLEQHIPVIKLEGKNVDTLSPEGLRTLLLSEYKKCNDSTSVLILVEQCSVNLYENFKNCGFISFARERGVLVTVVCWSTTTKVIGGNGTTTVLVPGPEDNKGEVEPERQDEMIVHKPLVADPRHQAENLKVIVNFLGIFSCGTLACTKNARFSSVFQ